MTQENLNLRYWLERLLNIKFPWDWTGVSYKTGETCQLRYRSAGDVQFIVISSIRQERVNTCKWKNHLEKCLKLFYHRFISRYIYQYPNVDNSKHADNKYLLRFDEEPRAHFNVHQCWVLSATLELTCSVNVP